MRFQIARLEIARLQIARLQIARLQIAPMSPRKNAALCGVLDPAEPP